MFYFLKLSLKEQILDRLYHAVQANYDVEFKTYPDNIMVIFDEELFQPLERIR